ncbi:MAG: hypothetical protein LBB58_02940 [Cellulomonadaceae bacterium]|jgi:hypothetical protein|nr:hypothetical protein [Cellulomonadaceae bacterium]
MAMTETLPLTFQPDTQSDIDVAWCAEIRRRIDDPNIQWLDEDEADAQIAALLAE